VGEYLRRLRIERATALLRDTRMPIAEIALVCGFSSQAHLTTMFRKTVGTTPRRFRTMHTSERMLRP
jgi:AraC family transcriptional regulator